MTESSSPQGVWTCAWSPTQQRSRASVPIIKKTISHGSKCLWNRKTMYFYLLWSSSFLLSLLLVFPGTNWSFLSLCLSLPSSLFWYRAIWKVDSSLTCLITWTVSFLTNYIQINKTKPKGRTCDFVSFGDQEFIFMFGCVMKSQNWLLCSFTFSSP